MLAKLILSYVLVTFLVLLGESDRRWVGVLPLVPALAIVSIFSSLKWQSAEAGVSTQYVFRQCLETLCTLPAYAAFVGVMLATLAHSSDWMSWGRLTLAVLGSLGVWAVIVLASMISLHWVMETYRPPEEADVAINFSTTAATLQPSGQGDLHQVDLPDAQLSNIQVFSHPPTDLLSNDTTSICQYTKPPLSLVTR